MVGGGEGGVREGREAGGDFSGVVGQNPCWNTVDDAHSADFGAGKNGKTGRATAFRAESFLSECSESSSMFEPASLRPKATPPSSSHKEKKSHGIWPPCFLMAGISFGHAACSFVAVASATTAALGGGISMAIIAVRVTRSFAMPNERGDAAEPDAWSLSLRIRTEFN